jgi:hypothetical protein
LDFNSLNIDNIQELSNDELVDVLFDSLMKMKKIEFIKEEKHELSKKMIRPNFDYIKTEIDFTDEDESRWRIKVPFIDEEQREYYKREIKFDQDIYYLLPESNGFVLCDSMLIEKPMGLVEIHHYGDFVSRMAKNHSFSDIKREYNYRSYFYFDYNENKYVQVPTEGLEKTKNSMKKPGFDMNTIQDERVSTYLERERLLEFGLNRLKEISENDQLHQKFLDFVNDKYDKGNVLSIENILSFIQRYFHYLNNDFIKWIKIKLLFSSITRKEYEKLIEETQKLDETRKDILQSCASLFETYLEGTKEERARFNLYNIQNIEGEEIRNRLLKVHFKHLNDFKTPKPREIPQSDSLLLQGFIGYDLETKELFPNISEIERRRLKTKEFYSDKSYKDYQNEVLRRLAKRD